MRQLLTHSMGIHDISTSLDTDYEHNIWQKIQKSKRSAISNNNHLATQEI